MMIWTDQETVLKRDAVVKLRSAMTNSIFQAELENLYIRKDAAYKDVTEAARTAMHGLVDRLESIENPPESIQQKMLELALELRTVSGKKQYAYLKKPLKDMVDSIVDELEKLPEVAAYVACCGTSPIPVMQMLKPDTQIVYLCLDNDKAGHAASERMAEQLRERGVMTERLVPELKD